MYTKLQFPEFFGSSNHADNTEFSNFLLQLKNQRTRSKTVCFTICLFYYCNFEKNYDVLKSKGRCNSLNKKMNFNKNETESKMEVLERRTLRFSAYKIANSKTVMSLSFAKEILSERNSFNICVLSQMYSVLNTLSEYTDFYILKIIISCTFLLVFGIVQSL